MEFIEQAARATAPDAVIDAMARHMAGKDVAFFSHRTILDVERTVDRTTIPRDWLDHYYGSKYYRIDPGIARVRTATGPIAMSFDRAHPTYHAEGRAITMFGEMRSFDACGSFFVPFRERPGAPAASVNFLTDVQADLFDSWLDAHAAGLQLCAVVAHTRIFELTRSGAEDGAATQNPLAARERECMQWLAQGLKSDRIAERMGISHRTVEFHLRNVRTKLGAATREHALAKALVAGWLDL